MEFVKLKKYLFNWLILGVLVTIGLSLLGVKAWIGGSEQPESTQFFAVKRASFNMSIVERGVVRPAGISPITSEISSNQAKIVWLVKEGSEVKKGQVVARFDTKPFLDEVGRAEQEYGDAEATYAAAQKLLLLQEEEEEGRIEEAERKVEIAGIDAQNIKNGAGPLERKQVEQKLKQALRSFKLASSTVEDMDVLLKKGHASLRESEKAGDELETAREQLNVARQELQNFDEYKWPKMVREAELLVNAAASELQRVRRTAELQIQNRMGQVEKSRRIVESKKKVLAGARLDLENCSIDTPIDGVLLYSEVPRESGRRKIQIGDSIWVGQTFLEVPDTSALVVEIQIREIDVAKIAVGMEAFVELDAFPGQKITGRVESIASLAEDDSHNNIRRFYARVQLLDMVEKIHVGMSATAEIIHNRVVDALVVPAGSVVFRNNSTMVYRAAGNALELVTVKLGAESIRWVQVLDGLKEGDRVSSALF
jgi:HlyD family secretion protein